MVDTDLDTLDDLLSDDVIYTFRRLGRHEDVLPEHAAFREAGVSGR
jgi:hypothetical protein